MNSTKYTILAMRTETKTAPLFHMDTTELSLSRVLHSALGCADEAGEIVKAIKDRLFYNKELDITNLEEEYGDQLWFIAQGLDAIGSSFEKVMEMNIRKLRARFTERFSDTNATERDLEAESVAMMNETHKTAGVKATTGIFGRKRCWPLHKLCPTCNQPDSSGDCSHKALSTAEAVKLGTQVTADEAAKTAVHEEYWEGAVPTICDLCKRPRVGKRFIDGKTDLDWRGIMCTSCHINYGNGLGAGKGQLYEYRRRGNCFVKIAGGAHTLVAITVDIITRVDLPEDATVVSETGAYHAIMSGQAKGEIVQLGAGYILRIRK